jgi:hypothetical protein
MLNITFGENSIDSSGIEINNLIIATRDSNLMVYLDLKNPSFMLGNAGDSASLLIEDSVSSLVIVNSNVSLSNISIREKDEDIFHSYEFIEV